MAESHVLAALRIRRAGLANDIRGMTEALAHLDATIQLLEGGGMPPPNDAILSSLIQFLSGATASPPVPDTPSVAASLPKAVQPGRNSGNSV